jgi:hypothetical protein
MEKMARVTDLLVTVGLGAGQRAVEKHGHGHGTHAARHGRDHPGHLARTVKVDVTDYAPGPWLRIDAAVDDHSAGLEPVCLDKLWLTAGSHHHVRIAHNRLCVCVFFNKKKMKKKPAKADHLRFIFPLFLLFFFSSNLDAWCTGMAHGNGGIGPQKKLGHGTAHEIAAANHHGRLSGQGDLCNISPTKKKKEKERERG